jgi:hypothetical protein
MEFLSIFRIFFSGTKWEAEFLQNVKDNAPLDVEVLRFSSLTLESELENNTNSVLPFFTLNVLIMIFFCVVTCMMTDWVWKDGENPDEPEVNK